MNPAWTWILLSLVNGALFALALVLGRRLIRRSRSRSSASARPAFPWTVLPEPSPAITEILLQIRLGKRWITRSYQRRTDIDRFLVEAEPVAVLIRNLANDRPQLLSPVDVPGIDPERGEGSVETTDDAIERARVRGDADVAVWNARIAEEKAAATKKSGGAL